MFRHGFHFAMFVVTENHCRPQILKKPANFKFGVRHRSHNQTGRSGLPFQTALGLICMSFSTSEFNVMAGP